MICTYKCLFLIKVWKTGGADGAKSSTSSEDSMTSQGVTSQGMTSQGMTSQANVKRQPPVVGGGRQRSPYRHQEDYIGVWTCGNGKV